VQSKAKIVFIVPNLHVGGAETVLTMLANELVKLGYQVNIIFLVEEGKLLERLDPRIVRMNIGNGRVYFSALPIRKYIRQINPDVIFPWMGYLNAYLIAFKGIFPSNKKWISRESTIPSMMNKNYRFSFLYTFFYKFYNRYDKIICQSAYMADDLRNNFDVKDDKLAIIPNPVDAESIPAKLNAYQVDDLPSGKFSLLYVGGLNKWKRVHILLDLMLVLPQHYHLTIVGEGVDYEKLNAFVLAKELSDRVKFIKGCTNPYPYYSSANCLLLCSAFEGFPNVALEAMATGCPVIGYNIKGGANEVLSNYGGFIVKDEKLEDFAGTVTNVCEHEKLDRERIIHVCREKYGLNKIVKQYQELID
jgi:glycosyltransferase involved in cell wall biosynthesis